MVLLYYLSQNPDFSESVKPIMNQLKNSEQMLQFLKNLSQFTQTFSTFQSGEMQKNSEDFSMQEALRLAKSPAGQQLLAMLRQKDNGQLQQVMDLAAAGNYTQASQIINSLLSSGEAQQLLNELRR